MDKGIRPEANRKFLELLPKRAEIGNAVFRKQVLFHLVEAFDCTIAAAATHYNFAFQNCKKSNPELVVGLGRPEGKNNGGRKKKVAAVAAELLLLGYTPAAAEAAAEKAVDENAAQEAGETVPEQTVFTVKRKSDDTVIGTFNFEDAKALIEKAAAKKKAKLYMV